MYSDIKLFIIGKILLIINYYLTGFLVVELNITMNDDSRKDPILGLKETLSMIILPISLFVISLFLYGLMEKRFNNKVVYKESNYYVFSSMVSSFQQCFISLFVICDINIKNNRDSIKLAFPFLVIVILALLFEIYISVKSRYNELSVGENINQMVSVIVEK